jgi:hypothetical protein
MLRELVDCVLEQLFRELGKEGSMGVDIKIISSRLLSSPFSLSLSLSLSLTQSYSLSNSSSDGSGCQ